MRPVKRKVDMSHIKKVVFALLFLMGAGTVQAGGIPSCYEANKLGVAPPANVELFVFVDQTTMFDKALKQSIIDNVGRTLRPGVAFSVGSFSSFNQGKYAEVIASGTLEAQIDASKRNGISTRLLRNFDSCMQSQLQYGAQVAWKAIGQAMNGSSSDLAKSDVVASLRDFSVRVRESTAQEKIVLIASDMLENSSLTSFYSNNTVRRIDANKELKIISSMLGDFDGARVYVIGTGMLTEDAKHAKGVYRSPQVMQALSQFWTGYFEGSNAKLVEMGKPALMNPIR
jgi:hypothetical protein